MNSSTNISNDSLQKKPVVSMDDGKRVGYISDLLIDPQKLKLVALVVKGDNGQSVLPLDQVKNIGADAITVNSMEATQSEANSIPGVRPFSEFHGQKVVDSVGTLLGTLHDVEFEAETGKITCLDVHSGGVFGIGASSVRVQVSDIRSFGPDLITANSTSVPEPAASA